MSEPPTDEPTPQGSGGLSIAEMLADLTWEQITSDGVITLEEVEEMLGCSNPVLTCGDGSASADQVHET